ncbi:MAG: OmpA family protein [Alphaproteobacteria bacterium]|nr:OmpA family protein [Alphaproteobacteria bacterium]
MSGARSWGPSVLVVLALAGCSSVPDAVNPVEWFRSASGGSSRSTAQPNTTDAKMAEAQARPTPNLGSVPDRPTRASTPAERQSLTQGLVADRENAKYTDDDLQPKMPAAQVTAARPAPTSEPPRPPPAAAAQPTPPAPSVPAAPPAAAAPAPPAPAARVDTAMTQPVPPPPPPSMPQVATSSPPPRPAAQPAAAQPTLPPAAPAAAVRARAPAASTAASVDQIYRQQLAHSESVVQLRQPVAEPPTPPPAQPRRIGALQHTARKSAKSQVAYVGGTTGAAPLAIRPGVPVTAIRFGEGAARLGPGDRETLARVAAIAQELGSRIRVVGHAGRPGGSEGPKREFAEFSLSLDRANAVAQELMKNGVTAERLVIEAVGDAEPLVIAGTAAEEAPNRRAEVFIE